MSPERAPFLKWAGGKRRLVPFIASAIGLAQEPTKQAPFNSALASSLTGDFSGRQWKRLIEPFAGSAAVSLALADFFDEIWLNDVNEDLMNLYVVLRESPESYIQEVHTLFSADTNNAETYYRLRDEFNRTTSRRRRAALFLYLNRHGYNGLCRYNNDGEFNVPFGRYKRPYFPYAELMAAVDVLEKSRLTCLDFEEVMQQAGLGDVVYCDPPYVPLSATASFTDYAAGGFGPQDQERLASAAEEACRRGAVVAISNHDTEWTRALYQNAEVHYTRVRRSISANGQTRGEVREVLAVYWPDGMQGGKVGGGRTTGQSQRPSAREHSRERVPDSRLPNRTVY